MKTTLTTIAVLLMSSTAYGGSDLPPLQYDYPFPGPIVITHRPTLEGICASKLSCACATRVAYVCQIFVSDDKVLKSLGCKFDGRTLRHEIGHCNGWPSDHPGARSEQPELGDSLVARPDQPYYIDPAQIYEGPSVIERFLELGWRRLREMGR